MNARTDHDLLKSADMTNEHHLSNAHLDALEEEMARLLGRGPKT